MTRGVEAEQHATTGAPRGWAIDRKKIGGDGGIRTLGAAFTARRFSKPLVSATHPRLRMACRANDSWPRRVAIAMHFAPRNA